MNDLEAHSLARQHILLAIDEIVARLVFQADRFQRFDAAVPALLGDGVTGQISSIALALMRYSEGEYEDAASLATIVASEAVELSNHLPGRLRNLGTGDTDAAER